MNLNINLIDIYNNNEKNLNLPFSRNCEVCDGKGIVVSEKKYLCPNVKEQCTKKRMLDFLAFQRRRKLYLKIKEIWKIKKYRHNNLYKPKKIRI